MTRGSRRKDKKQQEEGQEAAGGRTRGSRRKDKRQPGVFMLLLFLPPATSCPLS
jgi:hypothetical protein